MWAAILCSVWFGAACDAAPQTTVVMDNDYPRSTTSPLVIYQAYWQAAAMVDPVVDGAPPANSIPPRSSSDPQTTVPASSNTAYVVLAPGWAPDSGTPPTSFVVMESRTGFAVHLGDALHIPVSDETFIGNCAVGSFLSQTEADVVTQRVFPDAFAGLHYEAATCTTVPAALDASH